MTKNIKFYGYALTVNIETGLITGDTFNCKKELKNIWECKWDGNTKGWILNTKDMDRFLNSTGVMIVDATVASVKETAISKNSKCPKCGTYCYGDCKA